MGTTISELPAASIPYDTGSLFEMSVPDGSGGYESKKGNLADIVGGNLRAPSITITGTWPDEPSFTILPAFAISNSGGFLASSIGGVTLSAIVVSNDAGGLLTVSFDDLTGAFGNFQVSFVDATDIAFPELIVASSVLNVGGRSDFGTSISLPKLKVAAGQLSVTQFNNGPTFAFPELELVGTNGTAGLVIGQNSVVETISLPTLSYTYGLSVSNCAALTDISAPLLTRVGNTGVAIGNCASIVSVDLSLITQSGLVLFDSLPNCTSIDLSGLVTLNGNSAAELYLGSLPLLTTLDLPALKTLHKIDEWNGDNGLTTITFPVIEVIEDVINIQDGAANLTTFTLGSSLKSVGGDVTFSVSPLSQTSVDNILVRLAALDGTGGTTAYSNHGVDIVGPASAPSATGLAAKATLVGRGCTVTTN